VQNLYGQSVLRRTPNVRPVYVPCRTFHNVSGQKVPCRTSNVDLHWVLHTAPKSKPGDGASGPAWVDLQDLPKFLPWKPISCDHGLLGFGDIRLVTNQLPQKIVAKRFFWYRYLWYFYPVSRPPCDSTASPNRLKTNKL
jgi:hypothetical protein